MYGLKNLIFVVVEFYEPLPDISEEANKDNLLAREQFYLDLLFTLPAELRYNFSPIPLASIAPASIT